MRPTVEDGFDVIPKCNSFSTKVYVQGIHKCIEIALTIGYRLIVIVDVRGELCFFQRMSEVYGGIQAIGSIITG